MATSDVLWGVIFFAGAAVAAVAIHYYYTAGSWRRIPWPTHAAIILSNFICILPFPILVLDVDAAMGAVADKKTVSDVDSWVAPIWIAIFLLTQLMAWVVLPIAQEFEGAGELKTQNRLKRAVKENVKMYIAMGVVSGVLLGYVVFLKGAFSFDGIKGLILAAANAFGLVLLVVFLATGAVGVPRMLWKSSSPHTMLLSQYQRAREIHEELDLARTDLVSLRAEIMQLEPSVADDERHWIAAMLDSLSELEQEVPLGQTNVSALGREPTTTRHDSLVEVNVELKKNIKICRRLQFQWNEVVAHCLALDKVISHTAGAGMYWAVIREPLLKFLSVAAVILSVLLFFSELVVPLQTVIHTKVSVIEYLVHSESFRFVGSIVFLYYMAFCAYWAIFQIRLFDIFVIVPRISDAASLCFASTFLTRLIIPLCYNFLYLADLTKSHTLVTYSRLFGNMDAVNILGEWFNRFMPVLIPVLAVLIELGVFHRIMEWIGIEGWETGEQSHINRAQQIQEGQQLVARDCGGADLVPVTTIVAGALGRTSSSSTTQNAGAGVGDEGNEMHEGVGTGPSEGYGGAAAAGGPSKGQKYADWKAKRAAAAAGDSPA